MSLRRFVTCTFHHFNCHRVFGREAVYVDLEADPKIDRDNPPDLAKWVPEAAVAVTPAGSAPAPATQVSAPKAATPAAPAKQKKADSNVPKGDTENANASRHRELADVSKRSEQLLQKVRVRGYLNIRKSERTCPS